MSEFSYRLRRFLYQEFIPVTKTVALISGVVFLLTALIPGFGILAGVLVLDPLAGFIKPWTMITYPLFNGSVREFFSIIFGVIWLWFVGGGLERSWGSRTYGLFLFLTVLATGVLMSLLGFIQLGPDRYVYGLWLPMVGLTWAWAEIEPDREMMFWGIIPVKARWLAWIIAAITFFSFFGGTPHVVRDILSGLAAVSGIAVACLFTGKGPFSRGYRYYSRQQKNSGRWGEEPKRKSGRRRLRVIK